MFGLFEGGHFKQVLLYCIYSVGAKISTKKPFVDEGYDKRLDLTLTYKHKEGSAEERNAVLTAHRTAGSHRMDDAYAKLEKQASPYSS